MNAVFGTSELIVTVTVWFVVGCALSTDAEHDPGGGDVAVVVVDGLVVVVATAADVGGGAARFSAAMAV